MSADFAAREDAIRRARIVMRNGICDRANSCGECLRWRAMKHPVQGGFCDDHHRELRECDRKGEDALATLRREETLHKRREWLLDALNRAWLHGAGYAKPGSQKRGDMLAILADIEGELGPMP